MSLNRTALPGNILDRAKDAERRLDYLERRAAMAQADPGSGEGAITYIEILNQIEAGPDIDVVDDGTHVHVGRAGNVMLLFDSGGAVLRDYVFTDAGLTAALAVMAAGDVLWVPAGTITGGPWTLANGTLKGMAPDHSFILDGQLTVSDGTIVDSLKIYRSEDEVGAVYGVVDAAGGILATLRNCVIEIENATGPAYCIFINNTGEIHALKSDLIAEVGSVGYAFYIADGKGRHRGGLALGTNADKKFYWY